jgi:hypothetical protein
MVGMTFRLRDPAESLKPAPRRFYDELRRMLDALDPSQVDPQRSSVTFDKGGVEVELAHVHRKDWTIWMTVGDRDALVGVLGAHEHFFSPSASEQAERPWTTEIVDFVAEILRGEIEVQTTYRGSKPISVQHFNLDADGKRQSLGYTGFLTPARLLLWRPKRTESETASWG